MIMGELL